jgi:cytochrome c biogenesis protein CcmG/thiol:disulfide interchange protein DsbE
MTRARRDLYFAVAVCLALGLLSTLVRERGLAPAPLPELSGEQRGPAPGFALLDLAGRPYSLDEFRGRVVILNFWATWCGPCREELPSLDRLEALHRPAGLRVIAISLDRGSRDSVQRYIESREISMTILHDPGSQAGDRYGVRLYPTSVVVDRAGRIVARVPSAWDWAAPSVSDWLGRLLAEPAVTTEPESQAGSP